MSTVAPLADGRYQPSSRTPSEAVKCTVRYVASGGSPTGRWREWMSTIPRPMGPSTMTRETRPAGTASTRTSHRRWAVLAPSPRCRNGIQAASPTSTTPAAAASAPATSFAVMPTLAMWWRWRPPLASARPPKLNAIAARTPGRRDGKAATAATVAARATAPARAWVPRPARNASSKAWARARAAATEKTTASRERRRRRGRDEVEGTPAACRPPSRRPMVPPRVRGGSARPAPRCGRPYSVDREEAHLHVAERDRVAVAQSGLPLPLAVDAHAVEAAVVPQHHLAAAAGDHGVPARDRAVLDHHVGRLPAAEPQAALADRDDDDLVAILDREVAARIELRRGQRRTAPVALGDERQPAADLRRCVGGVRRERGHGASVRSESKREISSSRRAAEPPRSVRCHAHPRHRLARQGRVRDRRRAERRRPRRHRVRPRRAGLRGRPAGRARLRAGRPHRPRRRVRRRPRPRRGDPRRRDPRADPQPAARGVPQQPHGCVQRARGGDPLRGPALRQRLERDRPRLLLPRAPIPPRLRARRRGAPDPAPGSLRDGQALRGAAHGRGDAALRHPLPEPPPQLGAVGGQLRAQPRPCPARPGQHAERQLLGLHRRLRPRRRAAPGGRVRPRHARGALHRLTRQPRQPPARRPHPPPPRRCGRDPRAPPPPRRLRHLDRQDGAPPRLRADPLVARLPVGGRDAAGRRPRPARARRHRGSARALRGVSRPRPGYAAGMRALLAAAIAPALASPGARPASPQTTPWRGAPTRDNGVTGAPEPALGVLWALDMGAPVSYPVVAGDTVFVTTRNPGGDAYGTTVVALDLATGAVRWTRPIAGTYYWSGLGYDAGRLFVLDFDGDLTALSPASGATLWNRRLPGQYAFASPPAARDGRVYAIGAGTGGTVYGVRESDGVVEWTRALPTGGGAPAVDGTSAYVSLVCGHAYALNRDTGATRWEHHGDCTGGGDVTPAVHAGRVYPLGDNDAIYSAGSGAVIGSADFQGAPAFADGTAYVPWPSGLLAVDAGTWAGHWASRAGGLEDEAPLVSAGHVYAGSEDGYVLALRRSDGVADWCASTAGEPVGTGTGNVDRPDSGLGAGGGRLLVPAGRFLVAYGPGGVAPAPCGSVPASGAIGGGSTGAGAGSTGGAGTSGGSAAAPGPSLTLLPARE